MGNYRKEVWPEIGKLWFLSVGSGMGLGEVLANNEADWGKYGETENEQGNNSRKPEGSYPQYAETDYELY